MILVKTIDALQKQLELAHQKKQQIGFVPTMGALHQGHLSLIAASKKQDDITVASIFVNPTQFNDPKDFEKYPKTLEADILALERAGTSILFLPEVHEMYPNGLAQNKQYDLGSLETVLEGFYRPGHFQGVCMVVERLLQLVNPHQLYLGQKDFQQCMVIERLVQLMGIDINVNICPTERETDGLAMSSRNMRLNAEQRKNATGIYKALLHIKANVHLHSPEALIEKARQILTEHDFHKIDYVAIVATSTLLTVTSIKADTPTVALIATFMDEVRLIDNMLIN